MREAGGTNDPLANWALQANCGHSFSYEKAKPKNDPDDGEITCVYKTWF